VSGKRLLLSGVVGVAVLGSFGAAAFAGAPETQLGSVECRRALDPKARLVAVEATMRPVDGTLKMAMMFDLLRARGPGAPFRVVHGRGLGKWIHPANPTLGQLPGDVWNVQQKVRNLPAPARYRYRVRFRWTGAGGRVLHEATQLSPVCYEPELRPDLLVRSLTVKPIAAQASEDSYTAVIANRGLTAAGPFDVELTLAAAAPQSQNVPRLAPHASRRETFTGPACTRGSPVTVTVDPTREVDDYDRANNSLTVTCPAASGTLTYRRYTS